MNMKRLVISGIVLSLTFLAAACPAQDVQRLTYVSDPLVYQTFGWRCLTSVEIAVTLEAPEGVELPKLNCDAPLFGRWITPRAKDGFLHLAFDKSEGSEFYDLLYIDTNGDGSLADETALSASAIHTACTHRTGNYAIDFFPVEVLFATDDGPMSYSFHLNIGVYAERPQIRIMNGGYYQGTVEVDGTKYRCVLIDYNINGVYDDAGEAFSQADRILIGNSDGDLLPMFLVGRYLLLGDRYYLPIVDRNGTSITFKPAEDMVSGSLRVHADVTQIVVGGEVGVLNLEPEQTTVKVPVGEYHPFHWEAIKKDKDGRTWVLAVTYSEHLVVNIEADEETVLDIGPPMIGRLQVQQEGERNYVLNYALTDRNGGRFRLLCYQLPPPPKIRIYNADKSYDKTFNTKYMRGGISSLSWMEPVNAVGPFYAELIHEGPFEIVSETLMFGESPATKSVVETKELPVAKGAEGV